MLLLLSSTLLLFPVSVHKFLWNYSYWCFFCHVENDINGQITKRCNMDKIPSFISLCWKCVHVLLHQHLPVFFISWFVDGLDDKQCKTVSFVFVITCLTALDICVDRPSYPELCPSQPLPPLHLCSSRPRPGRPTQCFPCGSPSHDVIPLGLIHRIASPVGVSTLECPRWSVHAGLSALTFAAKPQLSFPRHHS